MNLNQFPTLKIICDRCKKEQGREQTEDTDSVICLYCGHRIR